MKYTIKTLLLGALFSIMLASNQSYAGARVRLGELFSAKSEEEVITGVENGIEYRQKRFRLVNSSTGRVVREEFGPRFNIISSPEASPTNCPNANCQNPPTDSQQQVLDQVTNQPSLTTDIVNQLPID